MGGHPHYICRYSSGHLIPIIQSYQDELQGHKEGVSAGSGTPLGKFLY